MNTYSITLSDERDSALAARVDAINAISQVPAHEGDPVPPPDTNQTVIESLVFGPLDTAIAGELDAQANVVKQAWIAADQATRDAMTTAAGTLITKNPGGGIKVNP